MSSQPEQCNIKSMAFQISGLSQKYLIHQEYGLKNTETYQPRKIDDGFKNQNLEPSRSVKAPSPVSSYVKLEGARSQIESKTWKK